MQYDVVSSAYFPYEATTYQMFVLHHRISTSFGMAWFNPSCMLVEQRICNIATSSSPFRIYRTKSLFKVWAPFLPTQITTSRQSRTIRNIATNVASMFMHTCQLFSIVLTSSQLSRRHQNMWATLITGATLHVHEVLSKFS